MCGGGKSVRETPEEKELAKIAGERWEGYKKRFVPVENKVISRAVEDLENPNPALTNMANVSSQIAFSNAEPQITAALSNRGARPSSGAFIGGLIGANTDRASSSSLNQVGAMGLQKNIALRNIGSLINMGMGQSSGALQGLGSAADAAQRQAFIDARASAAARAALGQAIGTGAGLAYGYRNNPVQGLDQAQADWAARTGN